MARTPWYEQDRPTTLQYEITALADHFTGDISLRDSIQPHVLQVIKTREKCVHDALVNLGWTPPAAIHDSDAGITKGEKDD